MSAKAAGTSPDYIQVLAQRDELLEAAKKALEFAKVYGPGECRTIEMLRQAIAACEKA